MLLVILYYLAYQQCIICTLFDILDAHDVCRITKLLPGAPTDLLALGV